MSKHPENPFQNYEDYMAKGPFQTIKLLLPFLPAANQKTMVILIKFLELKYTMDYFKKGHHLSVCSNIPEDASPLEKISSIIDFLPPKEQESIEQMLSMMSVMEAFQSMSGDEEPDTMENNPTPEEDFQPEENPQSEENFNWEDFFNSKASSHQEETSNPDSCLPSEDTPNPEKYIHTEEIGSSDKYEAATCSTPSDTASDSDAKPNITICSNIHF